MTRPIAHFTVAGIPIHVRPLFLALPVAGAFARPPGEGLVWLIVVALSVLWHELGHAFAMRRFGYEPRIELVAMGGLTFWPEGARPKPLASLVVSFAGPAAGLALGGAIWLAARGADLPPLARVAVSDARWVNLVWSLVNLLPIIPLDGSALLDHASRLLRGPGRPRWVGGVSLAFGVAGALVAARLRMPWAAILGLLGAAAGVERLRGRDLSLGGAPPRRRPNGWEGEPVKLRAARAEARAARARGDRRAALAALLPFLPSNRLEAVDLALLASALVAEGEAPRLRTLCIERLEEAPGALATALLVTAATDELVDAGLDEEALALHRAAFERLGGASHAYDAARCLVRLGRPEPAVAWLGRSIDAGLNGSAVLLSDPALAPLRERDDFAGLLVRVAEGKGRAWLDA